MKSKILHLSLHFILSFGLVSCMSDQSPSQPGGQDQSLEIQNRDGSFLKIHQTQRVQGDSMIALGLESAQMADSETLARVSCPQTSGLGLSTIETRWHQVNSLRVLDLLPVEVFVPPGSGPWQAACDLEIEVLKSGQPLKRIVLNRLEVLLDSLPPSFSLPTQTGSPIPHLVAKELEQLQFPLEGVELDTHLICREEQVQLRQQATHFNLAQLIQQLSWAQKSPQLCRLVVRDVNENNYQYTGPFWLQGEPAQFSTHLEPRIIADLYTPASHQPVASLTIRNTGSFAGWLRLSDLRGALRLRAVYSAKNRNPNQFVGPVHRASGSWELAPRDQTKVTQKSNQPPMVKLEPGETIELLLFASKSLQCSHGQSSRPPGSMSVSPCGVTFAFAGLTYEINQSLKIEQNPFAQAPDHSWTQLQLPLVARNEKPTDFPFFSPTMSPLVGCPVIKDLPQLGPQLFEVQNVAGNGLRACEWH